jgi:hypothetical protein
MDPFPERNSTPRRQDAARQAATKEFELEQTEKTEAETFCQKGAPFRYGSERKSFDRINGMPRPRMAAFESCRSCSPCQQSELPQENAARLDATERNSTQRRQDARTQSAKTKQRKFLSLCCLRWNGNRRRTKGASSLAALEWSGVEGACIGGSRLATARKKCD